MTREAEAETYPIEYVTFKGLAPSKWVAGQFYEKQVNKCLSCFKEFEFVPNEAYECSCGLRIRKSLSGRNIRVRRDEP